MKQSVLALAVAFALTACEGDNSHAASGGNAHTLGQISGTAASGSPLDNGSITIKDAQGHSITVLTDAQGRYSADLSQFASPALLEATGLIGGVPVSLHSVATQTGTVNITPLTDAILSISSDTEANECFLNAAVCATKLDIANLNQSQASLKTALAPLMQAVGLDSRVDLLRTAFAADKTGHDKLLEMVEVSAGSQAGTMRLQNKRAQAATMVSRDQKPNPLPADDLPDLSRLDELAAQLNTAYLSANGLDKRLAALLSDDFQFDGDNAAQYLAREMEDAGYGETYVGGRFSPPKVETCYSAALCQISMTVRVPGMAPGSFRMKARLQKEGWKLAGNDSPVSLQMDAGARQIISAPDGSAKVSLLNLVLSQYARHDNPIYSQPDRPAAQIVARSAQLLADGKAILTLKENAECAQLEPQELASANPDYHCPVNYLTPDGFAAVYNDALSRNVLKLRFYADDRFTQPVGKDVIPRAPLFTAAEIAQQAFPALTRDTLQALTKANGASDLKLAWQVPPQLWFNSLLLDMRQQGQPQRFEDSAGALANPLALNAHKSPTLTAPDFLRVTVWSLDRQGRGLYTRYQLR
ncbi:carboxypeptidase-like regulatory domain-containing protein [Chromobacterium piscinae]|uniref:carboxypeptidase-like regulatory domain-containing protein n=1 Tax=Chromobacterium piscinae TaxID=686831 RepID=UPI001E371B05|nr:carboxypeptidase-like regulatory domain-containing protein [Chromobacterium piscinae]MCD4506283.1 carboxypeptidase-like regulatory domain-containing protein [Chromobacterium piscinae]